MGFSETYDNEKAALTDNKGPAGQTVNQMTYKQERQNNIPPPPLPKQVGPDVNNFVGRGVEGRGEIKETAGNRERK